MKLKGIRPRHITVTSNYSMEELYGEEERELAAIRRRLKQVFLPGKNLDRVLGSGVEGSGAAHSAVEVEVGEDRADVQSEPAPRSRVSRAL